MTEWVSTSTAELIETGKLEIGDGYRAKNSEFSEHGIPFLRIGNLGEGRLLLDGADLFPEENLDKVAGKVSRSKDCVIATKATIGRLAYLDESSPRVLYSPQVSYWRVLDESALEPRFIRCWLVGREFDVQAFQTKSSTSMADYINLRDQRRMRMTLPPLDTQRKIASVVAAYDELIETNLRRIEILEKMAQAVYREWFVNFRFPGHENVALVDSPLGPIPEGWEVLVFEHVVSTLESGSRPRGGIDPHETGVPSVGAENVLGLGKYDYSKDKYISRSFFESMRRGHVRSGDVLLYKDGAKLGRKSLFRDGFPHPECAINEHVFLLRSNGRVSQTFLYFWLDLPVNTQRIIDLNSNAAQPGISQPKVLGLPILAPPVELVKQFDAVAEPLLALLFNLARQNRNLATTRELLLPRLVSGDIDVSEMEIDMEWLAS